jgi:hypothetical protein
MADGDEDVGDDVPGGVVVGCAEPDGTAVPVGVGLGVAEQPTTMRPARIVAATRGADERILDFPSRRL